MRTWIIMLVLVLAVCAVAQTSPQQPSQPNEPAAGAAAAGQAPAAGQTAAPQQQKTIKDPAEYNAYLNAIQTSDPNGKAVALEGFVQQYPNSVVKEDALEQLMAAYEQTGNQAKLVDTANRLLQANPSNLRALAYLAYTKRAAAQQGQNPQQNLADAGQIAQRGLQALQTAAKPEGMNDADWQKLKTQMAGIFNGALGISALNSKDYPTAQKALRAAAEATPNDFSIVYPLALADLQAPQPNWLDGIWWIARAQALAPPQMKPDIAKYGRSRYIKYHGGEDGWDQVMQAAATSPLPPAGFTIAPAPTPAEQAAKLVQSTPVNQMSFDQIQMVFTSGNQQAAEQVWTGLRDKPVAFEAKVIEATASKLTLSATAEDIEKNAPDVTLTMVAPIPARLVPKAGTMAKIEGTPVSYTPQPFMITMTKGSLLGAPKAETPAKPPAKRAPVRKRPGA